MKSALFVDFDNVYSGLRKLDPMIADRFSRQPTAWLDWLTRSLALPEPAGDSPGRRLLVRRCYLNPEAYPRSRPAFNRAGFEIIDCPPMTSEGKTSTDIHMVLDIVDLLQHPTHYDEFILFSADADFTPVLRRLRRFDRRTTVLAIGFPSAAYRASADLLIDPDEFVRAALGYVDEEEPGAPTASAGAPAVHARPAGPGPVATALVPAEPAPPRSDSPALDEAILRFIRQRVEDASGPIPLPSLAHALPQGVPGLESSNWAGHGGFRRLMESLPLAPLQLHWQGGGHIFDPQRHALIHRPPVQATLDDWGGDSTLLGLARRVHDQTGVPLLTPARYAVMLRAMAADLAEHPFQLAETGKRVRDRCREAGQAISRADVNFTLQGLLFSGHVFGQGQDQASTLAHKVADNVLKLCRREQMALDDAEAGDVVDWITGGLPERA